MMGTGALSRNCYRTSNQQIAKDRTPGKLLGIEAGPAAVGPALRPSVLPVQVDSARLLG